VDKNGSLSPQDQLERGIIKVFSKSSAFSMNKDHVRAAHLKKIAFRIEREIASLKIFEDQNEVQVQITDILTLDEFKMIFIDLKHNGGGKIVQSTLTSKPGSILTSVIFVRPFLHHPIVLSVRDNCRMEMIKLEIYLIMAHPLIALMFTFGVAVVFRLPLMPSKVMMKWNIHFPNLVKPALRPLKYHELVNMLKP
jgi:hypothetical protein